MPPVFDQRELLECVDNDRDLLAETVDMLRSDAPALVDQLAAAVASGDAAAVARAAHTLKGMISNFCAAGAQAAAFDLEKLGKSGDLSAAPAAMQTLRSRLDALVAALTDFTAKRT